MAVGMITRRALVALASSAMLRPQGPAHAAVELSEEQALVAEAWSAIKRSYVDQAALKAAGWEDVRTKYVRNARYRSMQDAADAVKEMVPLVGDHWTRYLPKEQLQAAQQRYKDDKATDEDGTRLLTTRTKGGKAIGLLRIPRMAGATGTAVRQILSGMEPVDSLYLDLRGNLGGSFDVGVQVASAFLPQGSRVVSVQRQSGPEESFDALEEGLQTEVPLHVLVDQNTASAAEILTAALRDNGRADVLGAPTYGKGLVQTLVRLGDQSGVEVTVARYRTPSGKTIDQGGIVPDRGFTALGYGSAADWAAKQPATLEANAKDGLQRALQAEEATAR